VVFGGDRFLVGSGSTVYSSLDGYAWSLVNATAVVPLAHLGTMWFGGDASAALYQSTDDGFTWTELRASDGGPSYAAAAFAMETP
jgi:aconitase B